MLRLTIFPNAYSSYSFDLPNPVQYSGPALGARIQTGSVRSLSPKSSLTRASRCSREDDTEALAAAAPKRLFVYARQFQM